MERHAHRKDQILNLSDLTEAFEPIVGQSVTLRVLQPEDQDIEHAFVSGLSPDTRHNRLLGGAVRITPEYIKRLTTVDFSRDMALAATTMLDGRETLIGVSRYVLVAQDDCEFAIVIADAWQGRGIGRRLMEKLMDVGRRRGVKNMYGDVLSTNRPMLEMTARLGFARGRHPDDPTLTRVTRAL